MFSKMTSYVIFYSEVVLLSGKLIFWNKQFVVGLKSCHGCCNQNLLSFQNTVETYFTHCMLKSHRYHNLSLETKLLNQGDTCKKAWKFRMNALLSSLNFLQDLIYNTHAGTLFYLFRLFLTNQVEEKAKFDGIFESLLPVNGLLSGDKVKPVLMNSKLPLDILGRVSMLFRFSYSLFSFSYLQCLILKCNLST